MINYDLFLEDRDLLEMVESYKFVNEGFFNRKPKVEYEKIDPQITPDAAIKKTTTLLNSELSKPENKIFKGKISINPKIDGQSHYNSFLNGNEDYLDIAEFNMEKIVGKYTGENEDKFWDANDLLENIIKNVNEKLNRDGYTLDVSDDSEIAGPFGLTLKSGARIKK